MQGQYAQQPESACWHESLDCSLAEAPECTSPVPLSQALPVNVATEKSLLPLMRPETFVLASSWLNRIHDVATLACCVYFSTPSGHERQSKIRGQGFLLGESRLLVLYLEQPTTIGGLRDSDYLLE